MNINLTSKQDKQNINPTKLLLFDIDGTLLEGGLYLHREAFLKSVEKIYGMPAEFIDFSPNGMIDRQILKAILKKNHHDFSDTQKVDKTLKEMGKYYSAHAYAIKSNAVRGSRECLSLLKERGYFIGLLTGNAEEIARQKMKDAGLESFFTGMGAFGDAPVEERPQLVPLALDRAEKDTGIRFSPEDVFIIGDTPRDIICAKKNGVRAICITGTFTREELQKYNPDLIIDSFSETEAILKILSSPPEESVPRQLTLDMDDE